jgi:hypothetical protein
MSNAARTARTGASATTPAATGTAPSAKPPLPSRRCQAVAGRPPGRTLSQRRGRALMHDVPSAGPRVRTETTSDFAEKLVQQSNSSSDKMCLVIRPRMPTNLAFNSRIERYHSRLFCKNPTVRVSGIRHKALNCSVWVFRDAESPNLIYEPVVWERSVTDQNTIMR